MNSANPNAGKPAEKSAVKTAINPTRGQNYPEWYQQIVKEADLAEHSDVRGCMVIKPWGYGIWELIQKDLDQRFKDTGHKNAYFPLLIPLSFLEKEAKHVEGFAKECAVVTHRRLVLEGDKLVPSGKLEEPFIIRPTSETIIGASFAKWIQSYRDLPLLINQWANVMRWEMRTRLFLRTSEFLWQEGHTAHESAEDAIKETKQMLDVYSDFSHEILAMPVIKGEKTEGERFPGAVNTYAIEALMQDGKALQAGTSHFLGQNFSRAQGIKFSARDGSEALAWTTSWGVSTRLIGGLIMTHSDDDGLVLPPRVAPTHVVIMPVLRNEADTPRVMAWIDELVKELKTQRYAEQKIQVEVDTRESTGGAKYWNHVKKGVPLILEVGARDVDGDSVFMSRRDRIREKKQSLSRSAFVEQVASLLGEIQSGLLKAAQARLDSSIHEVSSKSEFEAFFTGDGEQGQMEKGFAKAYVTECDASREVLDRLKVSIRCIPLSEQSQPGKCIFSGEKADKKVLLARAY